MSYGRCIRAKGFFFHAACAGYPLVEGLLLEDPSSLYYYMYIHFFSNTACLFRLLGCNIGEFRNLFPIVDTFHSYQARRNTFVITLSRHYLRSFDNLLTHVVAYRVFSRLVLARSLMHPVCELVLDRLKFVFLPSFPVLGVDLIILSRVIVITRHGMH